MASVSSDDYGPDLRFKHTKARNSYALLRAARGAFVHLDTFRASVGGKPERDRDAAYEALSKRLRRISERLPEPWIVIVRNCAWALIKEELPW